MGLEVLAKKFFTSSAVETFSTKLRVVCADSVANFEAIDLGANCCYNTNGFVT